MPTQKPADTREPRIQREDILFLEDQSFNHDNVCVVTGAGPGMAAGNLIPGGDGGGRD